MPDHEELLPTDPDDAALPSEPPVLPDASPPAPLNLKTLQRFPAFEANLAKAKLESAGIPAFVADENISAAHRLLWSEVRLQVAEADLERAAQVLRERPADGGDEDGEYVDEAYRCPGCHQKAVDLLPPSSGIWSLRLGCLGVLVLPLLFGVVEWMMPVGKGENATEFSGPAVLSWVAVLAVLTFIVLTAKRAKRCRECGNEWTS